MKVNSEQNFYKTPLENFIKKHERIIILICCTFAIYRIFLFNAAFPFFNNVDEQAHFDTVAKYARGYLPRPGTNYYDQKSLEIIIWYSSPEYMVGPRYFQTRKIPPPLWTYPPEKISEFLNSRDSDKKVFNHEALLLPLYYAVAGAWYNLGKWIGFKNGYLLYFIRFLNVGVYLLLILSAYMFCKHICKENFFLRISVPIMLAVFPQDLFYTISNDVLTPLFFLISLYLLFCILDSDRSIGFHIITGIMVAATFLVKVSNLPIIIIFMIISGLRIRKLYYIGKLKSHLPHLLSLLLSLILPIALWFGWYYYAFGNISGGIGYTIQMNQWARKPFDQIWHHPIFNLKNFFNYLRLLITTFWSGELTWHGKRIEPYWLDMFYFITTYLFLIAALAGVIFSKKSYSSNQKRTDAILFCSLLFGIIYLISISMSYDFGTFTYYPSRKSPYLAHGRLVSGALVPFLILYLKGIALILSKISKRLNPFVLVFLIAIVLMYAEISMTYNVFGSLYNWFHLP